MIQVKDLPYGGVVFCRRRLWTPSFAEDCAISVPFLLTIDRSITSAITTAVAAAICLANDFFNERSIAYIITGIWIMDARMNIERSGSALSTTFTHFVRDYLYLLPYNRAALRN